MTTTKQTKEPREADIQIDLIRDDVICRVKLEQLLVMEYGCLMLEGVTFPRIKVVENTDGSYTVQDGRTRLAAYCEAGRKMIPCIVYPKMPPGDILVAAFRDNYGIGQKMSFDDARYTISQLIEMGKTKKYITENLPYPKAQSSKLYEEAFRNTVARKCAKATDAMASNPKLSTADAAGHFGVSTEQLTAYISKSAQRNKKYAPNHIKASIALKYKGVVMFQASTLKTLMDRLMSGEVSKEYANGILAEFDDRATSLRKNLLNWENRFAKIDAPVQSNPMPYTVTQTDAGYVMKPNN